MKSSSAQEQESQSVQEKFKEKQEVQKNNSGNANGSKQNHSTGFEVQDYPEGLPTTISLVAVDQELKILSKAEDSFLHDSACVRALI